MAASAARQELAAERMARIAHLDAQGLGVDQIMERTGLSKDSVYRLRRTARREAKRREAGE